MPLVPDWFRPVAEYMLREGLPETLRLAAIALVASTVVGLLLGTFMTVRFFPLRWLIRFYVEVWRGLPILVTVLFIYWLPAFASAPAGCPPPASTTGTARSLGGGAHQRGFCRPAQAAVRFVFPMTAFFLSWYFLYVLLAAFAPHYMAIRVVGNVNIGLIFGLLQFVSTFAITTYMSIRKPQSRPGQQPDLRAGRRRSLVIAALVQDAAAGRCSTAGSSSSSCWSPW